MRHLLQTAVNVHTLHLRAELHLAKILEDMPLMAVFRHRINHLVLDRIRWRTPLQVSALLAHFPLISDLSVTRFSFVDYDTNGTFEYKQVPTLHVRRFRWFSGPDTMKHDLQTFYVMRRQLMVAFSRALVPNRTTRLEITDFDPYLVGVMGAALASGLETLELHMQPSNSFRHIWRWSSGMTFLSILS